MSKPIDTLRAPLTEYYGGKVDKPAKFACARCGIDVNIDSWNDIPEPPMLTCREVWKCECRTYDIVYVVPIGESDMDSPFRHFARESALRQATEGGWVQVPDVIPQKDIARVKYTPEQVTDAERYRRRVADIKARYRSSGYILTGFTEEELEIMDREKMISLDVVNTRENKAAWRRKLEILDQEGVISLKTLTKKQAEEVAKGRMGRIGVGWVDIPAPPLGLNFDEFTSAEKRDAETAEVVEAINNLDGKTDGEVIEAFIAMEKEPEVEKREPLERRIALGRRRLKKPRPPENTD